MSPSFSKRHAPVAVLASAYIGYVALTLNDMLTDAVPALLTLTVMWVLAVSTYPRQAPGFLNWLAPSLAVGMATASLGAVVVFAFGMRHHGGRWDCDGLTLWGVGIVGASLVRHIQLLMEEVSAGRAAGEADLRRAPRPL